MFILPIYRTRLAPLSSLSKKAVLFPTRATGLSLATSSAGYRCGSAATIVNTRCRHRERATAARGDSSPGATVNTIIPTIITEPFVESGNDAYGFTAATAAGR